MPDVAGKTPFWLYKKTVSLVCLYPPGLHLTMTGWMTVLNRLYTALYCSIPLKYLTVPVSGFFSALIHRRDGMAEYRECCNHRLCMYGNAGINWQARYPVIRKGQYCSYDNNTCSRVQNFFLTGITRLLQTKKYLCHSSCIKTVLYSWKGADSFLTITIDISGKIQRTWLYPTTPLSYQQIANHSKTLTKPILKASGTNSQKCHRTAHTHPAQADLYHFLSAHLKSNFYHQGSPSI